MPHYIYTREGAANALGLKSVNALGYYIKKAKAADVEPSRTIGGVEYFDVDILKNTPKDNYIKNLKDFISKQMKERKRNKHLQLKFLID